MLSFVLVDAFYLDIEKGIGIDNNIGFVFYEVRKTLLILKFDFLPRFHNRRIRPVLLKFSDVGKIFNPRIPEFSGDQFGESWITERKESSRRDAVRHIHKFFGKYVVEIFK